MDLRKRGKVPYGYRIENGAAVVVPEEAEKLKCYFQRYLAGESMAAAGRAARLPCCDGTLPRLLSRREYAGTEYYPPIITGAEHRLLMEEWRRRKDARTKPAKKKAGFGVRIVTEFELAEPGPFARENPAVDFYQRIRPGTYI